MFGMIRNAVVIGVIAWHSPVHHESPEARLANLQSMPGALLGEATEAAPRLALQAAASLDRASQEALARRIAEIMVSSPPVSSGSAR
jgi:hypothetical protein